MARVVIYLLSLGLTVYALIDCIQTPDEHVPHLPKLVWIVLIVLIPWVGPLAWLLVGRSRPVGPGGGSRGRGGPRGPQDRRPRGPRGPEDDPDFLRGL